MFEEDKRDIEFCGFIGSGFLLLGAAVLILFKITKEAVMWIYGQMKAFFKALIIILIIGIVLSISIKSCSADEVSSLLRTISLAESSYGMRPYGDGGNSLGKYHICAAVVIDYNRANGTNYKHKDLLDAGIDSKIARWHISRIIRMLKKRNIHSDAKVCQVWNEGFIAFKRQVPKKHKNLVYNKIYKDYWR
jgi:hypothetical protein